MDFFRSFFLISHNTLVPLPLRVMYVIQIYHSSSYELEQPTSNNSKSEIIE